MDKSKIKFDNIEDIFKSKDKPDIFNRGVLIFNNSGHPLTIIGDYYGCAEKQKGLCDFDEKMINRDKLKIVLKGKQAI